MLKPVPLHPKITTVSRAFRGAAPEFNKLFAVQAGVPVLDAMEHASSLLDTALKGALDVAMEGDDHKPWAVVYLLENTLALVNASVDGMLRAKQ